LKVLPLVHASEFCQIATRIQDRLVESPLLSHSETAAYDAEIVNWHDELPTILSNMNESCPDFLRRVRLIMKWRFQNIRIVLHRPALLVSALRRCPFNSLSPEDKVAVGKCRIIAAKTIEDISSECLPDLISGWNGVWFTFQACMVPLVSLFSDTSMPEEADKWCASIELALAFFARSKPWSIAAKRSLDAVSRMYQAYKIQFVAPHHHHHHPPQNGNSNGATPMQAHHDLGVHPRFPGPASSSMQAAGISPAFDYHSHAHAPSIPDMAAFAMHPGAVGGVTWNTADTSAMAAASTNLNGFWDDMMWDTNLPDMLDAPFAIGADYEFQGTAHDSGAPCWMPGN